MKRLFFLIALGLLSLALAFWMTGSLFRPNYPVKEAIGTVLIIFVVLIVSLDLLVLPFFMVKHLSGRKALNWLLIGFLLSWFLGFVLVNMGFALLFVGVNITIASPIILSIAIIFFYVLTNNFKGFQNLKFEVQNKMLKSDLGEIDRIAMPASIIITLLMFGSSILLGLYIIVTKSYYSNALIMMVMFSIGIIGIVKAKKWGRIYCAILFFILGSSIVDFPIKNSKYADPINAWHILKLVVLAGYAWCTYSFYLGKPALIYFKIMPPPPRKHIEDEPSFMDIVKKASNR